MANATFNTQALNDRRSNSRLHISNPKKSKGREVMAGSSNKQNCETVRAELRKTSPAIKRSAKTGSK